MYGRPGIAYVYLIYGMYACLNVVTEPEGRPAAVLIRAVEAIDPDAAEAMRAARWSWWRSRQRQTTESAIASERGRLAALPDSRVASGPGLVTAAFDATTADTGTDLLDAGGALRIESGVAPPRIVATARIGIGYAPEPWRSQPWRFIDPASPAVSGIRPRAGAS